MRLFFSSCLWVLCTLPVLAIESLSLERHEQRYSLEAVNVPLSEILYEIEYIEGIEIRPYGMHDRLVTATYTNITLEKLLRNLEISYALIYHRQADGEYALAEGRVMGRGRGPAAMDPAEARHIRKLIQDLNSDDIQGNAHAAQRDLFQFGCDVVPFLEEALQEEDYQGRHLVASLLRSVCKEYEPSDQLLAVTMDLLSRAGYDPAEYWSLFTPASAYLYLLEQSNHTHRIRSRLIHHLDSEDGQERFLSAALLARHGEQWLANQLVPLIAPHLMDNDLSSDGGVAARALYALGPGILPYLETYRNADDWQQADLVDLVYRSLQSGEIEEPSQRLYIEMGYRNPLREDGWPGMTYWHLNRFPDREGRYAEPVVRTFSEPPLDIDFHDADPFPYRIRNADETIQTIARGFAVLMESIFKINPDLYHDAELSPGRIILIPSVTFSD